MVEKTGGEVLGSNNLNASFGQPEPAATGFSFVTPTKQPTSHIYSTPQTSKAGNEILSTSTPGNTYNYQGFNTSCGFSLYRIPTPKPESSKGLFTQKNGSMVEDTGVVLFGSSNPNASRQLQPVGKGFSIGTSTAQPINYVFGTPKTSIAGTSTTGFKTSGELFGQQNVSTVGNIVGGVFGSNNHDTSFGQSQPVETGFSFVKLTAQPTSNIFGTPKTSIAGTSTTQYGNITGGTLLFGTPTASPASGGGLFGSNNSNTSFGQSQPVETAFSFRTNTAQPSHNIFGTPQTSYAGTGICSTSNVGFKTNKELFGQQKPSVVGNIIVGSNNPNTSFGQLQPAGTGFSFITPTAKSTSYIFGTPQTNNASTGVFGASTTGFNNGRTSLYTTPTEKPASSEGLFAQQKGSMSTIQCLPSSTDAGVVLFGSSNPNASFGQLQRIGTVYLSIETPNTQPISNIFGTPKTSIAGTGMNGASTTVSGSEIFGSSNFNSSFGQLQPVGTGFSFGTSTKQQTRNILGTTQTSTTGYEVFGPSSTGNTYNYKGFNTDGTSLYQTPSAKPTSSGELFFSSNPNTLFGTAPPVGTGFSFGTSRPQPTSYIFGSPKTNIAGTEIIGTSSTGSFGSKFGFGATFAGSTTIKFNPVTDIDNVVKNGIVLNQTINIRYQSITVMKEYESKIFEELKFEDYSSNYFNIRKQSSVSPTTWLNSTSTENTALSRAYNNKPYFSTTSTSTAPKGAESGEFFGEAGNTRGFNDPAFSKPTAPAVLFSVQTTQPHTKLFESTSSVPVFSQTPTPQPTFSGFNTGGISLFGNPATITASGGVFVGQQNDSTMGYTEGGFFKSNNSNTLFGQSQPDGTGFSFGTPTFQPKRNLFNTLQTSTADTRIFSASNNTGNFDTTSGFGALSADGTTIKSNPMTINDTIVGNSVVRAINTSNKSVSELKEYKLKTVDDNCGNPRVEQQNSVGGGVFVYPTTWSNSTTKSSDSFEANVNKPSLSETSTTSELEVKSTMTEIHQQHESDLQLMEQTSQLAPPNNQSITAAQIRRMPLKQLLQDPVRAAIYRRCWTTTQKRSVMLSLHRRPSVLRRSHQRHQGTRPVHRKPVTHSPDIENEVVDDTGEQVPPNNTQFQTLPNGKNDVIITTPSGKKGDGDPTVSFQKKAYNSSVKVENLDTCS